MLASCREREGLYYSLPYTSRRFLWQSPSLVSPEAEVNFLLLFIVGVCGKLQNGVILAGIIETHEADLLYRWVRDATMTQGRGSVFLLNYSLSKS